MNQAIKPCPFCGKELESEHPDTVHQNGIVWDWIDESKDSKSYFHFSGKHVPDEQRCYVVNCEISHGGCGANISGDTKEEAINNWNRREN